MNILHRKVGDQPDSLEKHLTESIDGRSSRMSEESGDHATSYSRWNSSTENVQIGVKEGDKPNACYSMSWKRWLAVVISSSVSFLILGFIIGYFARRGYYLSDKASYASKAVGATGTTGGTTTVSYRTTTTPSALPKYQRYTEDAFEKLADHINVTSVKQYIEEYITSGKTYHAGSTNINMSSYELSNEFCSSMGIFLKSVTFSKVLLSRPGATKSAVYKVAGPSPFENEVADSNADTMKPFVAYTQSGNATGPPVYVAFGRKSDFDDNVDYNGTICYVRYGHLSPYYKISNAKSKGCVGVVLYPDPEEFPDIKDTDRIISNGKRVSGDPQTPGFASYSVHTYRMKTEDIVGKYIPPDIPVITASQQMVIPALASLITNVTGTGTGSILTGSLGTGTSNDTTVSIEVNNEFPHENTFRSVCAYRGTVDSDKMVIVGARHDEAGSGAVDPATGQAIMREMLRLITQYPDVYKPRRSIVFVTTDASYLDIASQEFIEENLREYGERIVAYVALTGTLSEGSYLSVKSSPPIQKLMQSITANFPEITSVHHGVNGSNYYRRYMANLGVPVVEMSFTNKLEANISGLDSLPICCDKPSANTDEERIKLAAKIHLQTIMRLAGEPILPYDISEIQELYFHGIAKLAENHGEIDALELQDLVELLATLISMLHQLEARIKPVLDIDLDDVNLRRLNDALTGLTRACILSQGVPMIDPQDNTKVIRNLNNRNMLIGSVSYNEDEVILFPGLQELLSVESPSDEIINEMNKHVTEIMTGMGDVIDYSMRAIAGRANFLPK